MASSTAIQSAPALPSNTRFGWVIALALGLLAAYFHFSGASVAAAVLAGVGAVFGVLALLAPGKLATANRWWFALGMFLGRVVSPVVLAAMYFLLITPVALVGRMAGRDALRLKKNAAKSYWVQRDAGASDADTSFKNQF